MGFWESVTNFCQTNPILLAVCAVLGVTALILEKFTSIKTPISSFVGSIKNKKKQKEARILEHENYEKKLQESVQCLIETNKIIQNDLSTIKPDIKTLKEQQDRQQKTIDEDELDRIRWEILHFANSCRYERRHTRNEFEHVITLSNKYEVLLSKTNQTNGVFEAEYDYIIELYKTCLRDNTFLA